MVYPFEPTITTLTDKLFFPLGDAFLQSLFMIVVPIILSSLIVGVSKLGSGKNLGRLSAKLFLFYAFSTILAISIGQALVNSVQPGKSGGLQAEAKKAVDKWQDKLQSIQMKSSMVGSSLWPGIVRTIIPRNIIDQFGKTNILAVIFVSLLFGVALRSLPDGIPKESFSGCMIAISNMSITIIGWIMKTAPYAVAALLIPTISEFGIEMIVKLSKFILVMAAGMLLHLFVSYSFILKFLIRIPIKEFFARMIPVFTTAFGTSSSNATMPVTMNTLETKFGLPRGLVNFSVPIGATVNMDGTALFEVVAAIFIAQVFGVELTLLNHILLIALVFITSIGIAGVPGGSIPVLMASIVILNIPAAGIALLLGVDRLLDMSRTTVNVTGDSLAALFLARSEGIDLEQKLKEIPR